jgi:hypothetical protein
MPGELIIAFPSQARSFSAANFLYPSGPRTDPVDHLKPRLIVFASIPCIEEPICGYREIFSIAAIP